MYGEKKEDEQKHRIDFDTDVDRGAIRKTCSFFGFI